MPEIAEVALMADAIRQISQDRLIEDISILGGRYLKKPLENLDELKAELPLRVLAVKTKGKRCWLELGNQTGIKWWLLISFGMSGAIYYEPREENIEAYRQQSGNFYLTREEYMKFYHIRVKVDNPDEPYFYFGDMRQFGSWRLFKDRLGLAEILDKLGPDMLTGPELSDEEIIEIFRGSRFRDKNICKVLMSQEAVSGVGNYIRCEVLHQCGINPWALVSDLDDQKLIEMVRVIRTVAESAYQGHGASLYTYTGIRQEKGNFQNLLKVYGRKRCPKGYVVRRETTPDQRTCHWVPELQTIGSHRQPGNVVKPKLPTPVIKLRTKL